VLISYNHSNCNFRDGTTDITRTFHFGTPSDHQREAYTRVLKGQIAIAKAIFPEGTRGYRLDAFARQHLWDIGKKSNIHTICSKISFELSRVLFYFRA